MTRDRERASGFFPRRYPRRSPPVASNFAGGQRCVPVRALAGWRGRRKSTSERGKARAKCSRTGARPPEAAAAERRRRQRERQGCRRRPLHGAFRLVCPPKPPFATAQRCSAVASPPSAGGETLLARGKGPVSRRNCESFSQRENSCGRKGKPRAEQTTPTTATPPSRFSRGARPLGDQTSKSPGRPCRSARCACPKELEHMPPQGLGCGGASSPLHFEALETNSSLRSLLAAILLSLTAGAWQRREPRRRPCVPRGPRAWTGRGKTASLRRGGGGSGGKGMEKGRFENLRKREWERERERKRERASERARRTKKKKSRPPFSTKPFSLTLDFLLLALLSFRKKKKRQQEQTSDRQVPNLLSRGSQVILKPPHALERERESESESERASERKTDFLLKTFGQKKPSLSLSLSKQNNTSLCSRTRA